MNLPTIPSLTRLAAGVFLLLLPASVLAQKAGVSVSTEPQTPKFIVKGRAVFDGTDRPVRRAQIALMQLSSRSGLEMSGITDRDGQFVIADVPTGVYFAMVNLPGIISPLAFMSATDRGEPENFNVKAIREYCTEVVVDGGNVNVIVRAKRGGAISGRITYSDGEPAIDAQVAIIRRDGKKTSRVLTGFTAASLLSLRTDDRGRYRIAGIPPGEYIVSAAETNTSQNGRRGRGDDFFGALFSSDSLVVSYYSSGTRLEDAIKLEVTAGSELSDIDVTLADSTPHTVRGSVIAKLDRLPLPDASLSLRMRDQASWFGSDAQQIVTDEQGTWMLDGIPDGTYVLTVEPPGNFPAPGLDSEGITIDDTDGQPKRKNVPTRKFVRQETEITVSGGDLVLDPIALAEGASISGTIEWPNNADGPRSQYVQILYRYEGEPPTQDYRNSTSASGGEFTIEGMRSGKVYLMANPGYAGADTFSNLYVKSITLNGIDLRQKPLTIAEGQSIKNIHIVIAENPAKGIIKLLDNEGKPRGAKRVAVVSVDEGHWLFGSDTIEGITDSRGMFAFTAAPGEYLVIVAASDDFWPPAVEVIRERAPSATHIKLASGDNQPVTVVVP